jgi:hypothetical protein
LQRPITSPILFFLILFIPCGAAPGQIPGYAGGYGIELGLGVWLQGNAGSSVSSNGAISTAKSQGMGASLGFHHWSTEHLAVGLTASVINAEANVLNTPFVSESQTSAVSALMLDLQYQLPIRASGSLVPYLHASAGPVFGFRASSGTAGQVASTQTVLGGRVGAGLNMALSHLVVLGFRGSYLVMSEFSEPIAGRKQFNGGEVLFCIALVWGGDPIPSE